MAIKKLFKDYQAKRKESSAYKNIVNKRTLQARREAYAKESVIQAKIKGKELARAKAQGSGIGKTIGKAIVRKVLSPPKKGKIIRKNIPKKKINLDSVNPFMQSVDTGYMS